MILHFVHQSMKSSLAALSVLAACALLPSVASAACANNTNPNLAKNPGFEMAGASGTTIPDWSVAFTPDGNLELSTNHKKSGAQSLAMGSNNGENRVYQTMTPTAAGSVYQVCFWLANAATGGTNRFRAQWNNQDLMTLTNAQGTTAAPFLFYSFTITATGSDVLSFEERNPPGYWFLDDVSVQLCSSCTISPSAPNTKQREFPPFVKTP